MTGAPTTGLRVWQGIEAADPPCRRHNFDQLLKVARIMLRDRQKGFPALIASGEKSAADAAAEIAAFEDLVADWTFIESAGRTGEPSNGMSTWALRKYLDAAIETLAGIARQRGGFDRQLHAKTECVIALRWHLEPGRDQIGLTRLTRQLRDERTAAHTSREPASCH